MESERRRSDPPKVGEREVSRGDAEAEKAHRHRFSDGEKTTIMPLAEILKARDAARGSTPTPAVLDHFPEFSYQPTVQVAIPADFLKKKQAEAARDKSIEKVAKENTKTNIEMPPVKHSETPRVEGATTRKTTGGVGVHTSHPPPPNNLVISGEYTLKEATHPQVAQPPELRKPEEKKIGPPGLKPAIEAKPALGLKPTVEPKTPPDFKSAGEVKAPAASTPKPEEALPDIAAPMAPPAVPSAPDNTNQVVVFFSCKGGSGATALSANVAHYCASEKKKTVLVDLDLQLGDALAAMSLQPAMTIAKAMEEVQRGTAINTLPLPRHTTGVSVLSQVGSLDDLDKISSEGISRFVEGLRGSFDTIVVDGVRDFSDNVLAVLDMADKIAIVTVQEVLAIKRARWAFGILRKIGFDGRDITVVINRYTNDEMIPFRTLKQMFDPAPVFAVPADGPLVLQSLNHGTPLLELSPQHTVTRNIARLAKNLLGEQVDDEVEATVVVKSFWNRLRPGKHE
jgi:MinD-like ATPase involved in chromosome partitioning or flagellar assembly